MTLQELANETLVQKHTRLMQAKCEHEEIYSSTFIGPNSMFTDSFCLDCGKSWTRRPVGQAQEPPDMVGKYKADYSPLTPEEIAKDDPELTELYENSRPVGRPLNSGASSQVADSAGTKTGGGE